MPTRAQFAPAANKLTRVLYAEDQTSSRVVTTALLQRLGYQVKAVEDGERAVECAREEFFDVILLDIEMPVMDGVTAARMIRSEETPCRNSPIVALSAFLADSTEASQWRDAFDSALPKPANSDQLQTVVTDALQKRALTAETLIEDLQTVLPRGAWTRLVESAAAEMHAITLTWAACVEAGDIDNVRKSQRALARLASNFCADEIAEAANDARLDDLLARIARWKQQNQR